MDLKILIRFDDICPTMDFVQFNRAVELMDRYSVKPLIGVIPNCKDNDLMIESQHEDFWNYVKFLQAKGYTVAMHGYEHVFCSQHHGMVNRHIGSEFAGLTFEVQKEKIQKGKAILESHGITTDIFFAPAHSYDRNTLKALASCGFKFISDGKSKKPYILEGITCIPCRSTGAANIKGNGYYTSVFHAHEWTRPEKADAYNQLVSTLNQYASYVVSFEEFCAQPVGRAWVQQISEKAFLIWEYFMKPKMSKLYHTIK